MQSLPAPLVNVFLIESPALIGFCFLLACGVAGQMDGESEEEQESAGTGEEEDEEEEEDGDESDLVTPVLHSDLCW